MRTYCNYRFHAIGLLFCLLLTPCLAAGAETYDSIGLLDAWQDDTVSASRVPKPVSQSAENITVITAAEIKALNAHTLADILATIPGIQLESSRTPGSVAYLRVQGASFNHVQVMLDGVTFNNLADNIADIGLIPARIIERVELVKGAASSAWGQALGGVINVITKSPDRDHVLSGAVSSSWGERRTTDNGLELTGSQGKFGYYLSSGYSGSLGLLPNNQGDFSNAYAKLSYDLPDKGQLSGTVGYFQGNRGDFIFTHLPDFNHKEETYPRQLFATLQLHKPLNDQFELELLGRQAIRHNTLQLDALSAEFQSRNLRNDETDSGFGAKLLWRTDTNILALGLEYDHVWSRTNDTLGNVTMLERRADRWGFYLNDTLVVGDFSFSPGIRLDLTASSGDQVSPSFGITWQLTPTTLLRGYTAKGYSLPSFLLEASSEKVWTSQIGLESTAIPYLWLKTTLFRNETWDVTAYDTTASAYKSERQLKHGVEFEAKTNPVFATALSLGYSFVDARNTATHEIVKDIPRHTLHLGLQFDDQQYLKALLNGRHVWWNAAADRNGSYGGMLWDLHLTATPWGRKLYAPELFLSLRNIFNGSQYLDEAFQNTGRWVEGGLRVAF